MCSVATCQASQKLCCSHPTNYESGLFRSSRNPRRSCTSGIAARYFRHHSKQAQSAEDIVIVCSNEAGRQHIVKRHGRQSRSVVSMQLKSRTEVLGCWAVLKLEQRKRCTSLQKPLPCGSRQGSRYERKIVDLPEFRPWA